MNVSHHMLTISHLTKRLGAQTIIEDLSFTVARGARVTIFGPSGAGKTTLINILTGLEQPDSGAVTSAAANPATIFQEPRLFPFMTVEENIFVPVRIRKIPVTAELTARYRRWLDVCEMGPYTGHYPQQLSGGMKQKSALIRGFLTAPDLVLLDEPFKSIDLRAKQAIIRHILEAHSGVTILFVTHALDEVPLLTQSLLLFKTNRLSEFTLHDAARLSAAPLEVIYG